MSEHDLEERRKYQKKLDELWLCVLGNGHPEQGMKWKLEQMMDFTHVVKRVFWLVTGVAITGGISAICLLIWNIALFLNGNG